MPSAATSGPSVNDPASPPDAAQPPAVDETILVTATRSARSVSELPVSATVIRQEDLQAAPVRSVDDLLRTVAGVNISLVSSSGSTPNQQRISMHGLGGIRTLVLVDGIPLHDPYSGIVEWQNVPLDTLRQIEVVRGGNSSLYGNFALGGTINLLTRPIDGNEVTADLSYGSGRTKRAALGVDYAINPTLSIRISHHHLDSDGFVRVPDPGPIDVDAWTRNAITAIRADLHLSETASAFVNAGKGSVDLSQGTPSSFSKRDTSSLSGGFQQAIGAESLFSANGYYQSQREHYVNSTILGTRLSEYVSQDGVIPSNGGGASAEWALQRHGAFPLFTVGIDLHQVEASEERVTFNRSGVTTQRERVGGRQRFAGIFAQTSWTPTGRLELLASTRFDSFRSDQGSDVVAGGSTTRYPATTSNQLDPRVSVRYSLGAGAALRASAYRAFNAPTLRDLYRNSQSGNSVILGNPSLVPETLTGAEVGWEWVSPRARVEMNLYRSVIDGVQSRINVNGSPNVFQNANLGSSRSQGVEVMGDLRLTRRLSATLNYTYADATVTDDPNPDFVGKRVVEVPAHTGALSLRYRGAGGTLAELRGRIVSRSYIDAGNLAVSPESRVVDLSLSQPLRSWLDAYVLVENVFDENYYLALAVNSFRRGLPRTVTAGFRVTPRAWGRR